MTRSWTLLATGLFIIAAPWAFGMGESVMVWVNAVLGAIVVLIAAWQIFVRRTGV